MNLPLAAPAPTRADAVASPQRAARGSAARGDDFAAVLGSQVDRRSEDRASRRDVPVRDDARAVAPAPRRQAGMVMGRDDVVPGARREDVASRQDAVTPSSAEQAGGAHEAATGVGATEQDPTTAGTDPAAAESGQSPEGVESEGVQTEGAGVTDRQAADASAALDAPTAPLVVVPSSLDAAAAPVSVTTPTDAVPATAIATGAVDAAGEDAAQVAATAIVAAEGHVVAGPIAVAGNGAPTPGAPVPGAPTTATPAESGTAPVGPTAAPTGAVPGAEAPAAPSAPGSPTAEAVPVAVPARLAHIAATLAETVPTTGAGVPADASATQATALPAATDNAAGRVTPSGMTPVAAAAPPAPTTGGPAPTSAPSAPMPSALPERAVATQLTAPITSLRAVGNGEHVMVVRVSPDTIGPVRVRAHLGADGVRIELLGATEGAREALKVAMPDLRRDLIAAGFPADMSLSTGRQSTGSDTGWAGGGSAGDPRTGAGRQTVPGRAAASSDPDPGPQPQPVASGLRGLDITV